MRSRRPSAAAAARRSATPTGLRPRRNPSFTDVLPGPSTATGVPNFIIRKFRVPPFLLSIYQAAGIEYGVRWEVLAAINEIETDYGRNLNVSSAGALGWMQFMPSTWKMYGVDANKDGRKDPYNPVDAIFAAARYLKAAGYEQDVRRSIFAYNHADWYVDSVLLRARLIAGVPADVIGSLTGLTEGRFPVFARARYADDIAEQQLLKKVKRGENAAHLVESRRLAPQHRHLRQEGRAGRGRERRRHQEDRQEQEARPLRRAPGRLRQPLHLRAPRPGLEGVPGAEGRRHALARPQRPRSRRQRVRPDARRARVGRPPARLVRHRQGQGPRRRRAGREGRGLRAGQAAPVRASRHAGLARGRRPRAAARLRGAPAAASSRPSRPTSRARSASIPRRSASARSARART